MRCIRERAAMKSCTDSCSVVRSLFVLVSTSRACLAAPGCSYHQSRCPLTESSDDLLAWRCCCPLPWFPISIFKADDPGLLLGLRNIAWSNEICDLLYGPLHGSEPCKAVPSSPSVQNLFPYHSAVLHPNSAVGCEVLQIAGASSCA